MTENPRVAPATPARASAGNGRLALLLITLTALLSLTAVAAFDRANAGNSVFLLSNLVGPTAQSLVHGRGLTACTEAMGTPGNPICFHAGRMPLPTLVVAAGESLLGDHYLPIGFAKALLLLLPLELAVWVACSALPRSGRARWLAAALLALPFLLTPFLADVVNLQVEEGYAYSLIALAAALVLFHGAARWWRVFAFALAADGLYLSKSAMIVAVAVLALAFLLELRRHPAKLLVAALLLLCAPLGWAVWQHHAAGRYSLGTSIDGINLHKGNDEIFLAHYPPPPGDTLDQYDDLLNRGQHFNDEWSYNDFHKRAALAYIAGHPGATAQAELRKLAVIFVSVRKLGSAESHGAQAALETVGLLVFRLLFWASLLVAVLMLWRRPFPGARFGGAVFLALVGAVALPYLLGFAYTRHVSVLIYPAVLLCTRALAGWSGAAHAGGRITL